MDFVEIVSQGKKHRFNLMTWLNDFSRTGDDIAMLLLRFERTMAVRVEGGEELGEDGEELRRCAFAGFCFL